MYMYMYDLVAKYMYNHCLQESDVLIPGIPSLYQHQ